MKNIAPDNNKDQVKEVSNYKKVTQFIGMAIATFLIERSIQFMIELLSSLW